jgi:hypothetical protein
MIRFIVTAVNRNKSSQVNTTRFTYPEGKDRVQQRIPGAEWEEVEFMIQEEEKPKIAVANVMGSAFLVGQPCKLVLNDPELFGTYKIGDIVPFAPLLTAPSGDHQPSPSRTESDKGA